MFLQMQQRWGLQTFPSETADAVLSAGDRATDKPHLCGPCFQEPTFQRGLGQTTNMSDFPCTFNAQGIEVGQWDRVGLGSQGRPQGEDGYVCGAVVKYSGPGNSQCKGPGAGVYLAV